MVILLTCANQPIASVINISPAQWSLYLRTLRRSPRTKYRSVLMHPSKLPDSHSLIQCIRKMVLWTCTLFFFVLMLSTQTRAMFDIKMCSTRIGVLGLYGSENIQKEPRREIWYDNHCQSSPSSWREAACCHSARFSYVHDAKSPRIGLWHSWWTRALNMNVSCRCLEHGRTAQLFCILSSTYLLTYRLTALFLCFLGGFETSAFALLLVVAVSRRRPSCKGPTATEMIYHWSVMMPNEHPMYLLMKCSFVLHRSFAPMNNDDSESKHCLVLTLHLILCWSSTHRQKSQLTSVAIPFNNNFNVH